MWQPTGGKLKYLVRERKINKSKFAFGKIITTKYKQFIRKLYIIKIAKILME
jgi:hypothetical protein